MRMIKVSMMGMGTNWFVLGKRYWHSSGYEDIKRMDNNFFKSKALFSLALIERGYNKIK